MAEYKYQELTRDVINAAYAVDFEAQLLNYLKAAGLEVGLIINFGPSVEVKRMVL
jgi:GxxExxY protein